MIDIAAPVSADEISKRFDAISILLAFTTVYFGVSLSVIQNAIDELRPQGDSQRKKLRDRRLNVLNGRAIPLTLLLWAFAYLLFPTGSAILYRNPFAPWDFDFVVTAYVFVLLLTISLALWASRLSWQLWRKVDPDARAG